MQLQKGSGATYAKFSNPMFSSKIKLGFAHPPNKQKHFVLIATAIKLKKSGGVIIISAILIIPKSVVIFSSP